MKKAFIYSGNLEYSGMMVNPERWVKAADYEKLEARAERIEAAFQAVHQAVLVQENEHCKDCCCARSWKALGIDTYTINTGAHYRTPSRTR